MAKGFGIIGVGTIADFHARAIAELRGARLVACHGRRPEATRKFATSYDCRPYDSVAELLDDPDLDVVTICTPSGAHAEPAIAAAHAGKHVVVEKPLEISLRRCDAIIEACAKNRIVLSTIFPSRFHPSAKLIKKALDQNRFGRLTLGDAFVKWYRSQAYYDSGAWRGTWDLDGGGALMNQAIHSVDLLAWFMGPVTSVTARTAMLAHERIEVEDVAVATIEFASGALGVIEATTAAYPGYLKRIEIHGSEGSAILEEENLRAWDFAKPKSNDAQIRSEMASLTKTGGGAADPKAIGHHGHLLQLKDVLQAINRGTPPAIDGHEGRKSVEIILAIYQSANSGRPVTLPLTSGRRSKK